MRVHLQRMPGGWRIVIVSAQNGKCIAPGQTVKDRRDAQKVKFDLHDAGLPLGDDLKIGHRWPRNAGPKKKK